MDELSYLSRPARGAQGSLLNDLHSLNRQFLELILAAEPADRICGLDAHTVQSVQQLSERERERMANCPYSLFDLSFSNPAVWRSVLTEPAQDHDLPDDPASGAFALGALLFARQLCQYHDDMARLVLGMTEDVVRLLATPELAILTHCALTGQPPLLARLADHPNFWSDICDFVRDGTREQHLAAHTLGVQQSAARF
jgi:hypothetical protein